MYLEFSDFERLAEFVQEAKKAGFLKDLDISSFSEKQFPIRVPVNLEAVLKVAGSPVFRPFRKKMEATIMSYVETMA